MRTTRSKATVELVAGGEGDEGGGGGKVHWSSISHSSSLLSPKGHAPPYFSCTSLVRVHVCVPERSAQLPPVHGEHVHAETRQSYANASHRSSNREVSKGRLESCFVKKQ